MQAWIFDIDGVLTDVDTRQITNPHILPALTKILERQEPLAIMSGRAMQWIIERVLSPLEKITEDKHLLNNFFLSGEFGGVYGWYKNGIRQLSIHQEFSLPEKLKQELKTAAQHYTQYVFVDKDKQTHFTAERNYDCSPELFAQHESKIAAAFAEIVETNHLEKTIHIHEDRLAVNVRHIRENKKEATQALLNWLQRNNQTVDHYVAFGDSTSDLEIGQALSQKKLPFTFVFVGEKELVKNRTIDFPITYTQNLFAEGTVEFLQQHLS